MAKNGSSPDSNGSEDAQLKRVVGIWGSFSMGYADVGADIYIALGLVALFAGNASPIAFAVAAITYIATGLGYAELASTYPVAGGAQYYSLKAFGPLHGFLAGWGLMLDYTIDIALFALASIGYFGSLVKMFTGNAILLSSPYFGWAAIILILLLIGLNIFGIRWSSAFNQFFVLMNLVIISLVLIVGLAFVSATGGLAAWAANVQSVGTNPSWGNLAYATSIAMVSYVGIESISQAAEETRYPKRVIPKATKWVILAVVVMTVASSLLSVTLISTEALSANSQAPMIAVVASLPFIGALLSIIIAFTGFAMCYVSTNTGVIGVSRVTFSMGRLKLFPSFFGRIHPRYRTPYITITVFSLVAIGIILLNNELPGVDLLGLIASLYNFGALVAYMYVNLSLIELRVKDPRPRAWKSPLNLNIPYKGGKCEVPMTGVIGFLSCMVVWILIVGTHPAGRVIGTIWFTVGFIIYLILRRRAKRPSSLSPGMIGEDNGS
ncbi:MAG: APC family permease [Thaumarchaeota archaeon]|nr:APC family permease [Nitrososphaerota archaeon]MCL5318144.1 APC family permease [Nitrososphaerota archaeon]